MLGIFKNIEYMTFIVLIPIIILIFTWTYYRKKRFVNKYFSEENFVRYSGFRLKRNMILRTVFASFFLLMLVLALARPGWGRKPVNIKREGSDVVIAVDISSSMNTQDIKPSRYFRVKQAVKELLDQLKGDRVSLVFFGGDAFVMIPFTLDYYTVKLALDNLDPQDFPMPGTNYGNLFLKTKDMLERSNSASKMMVIFSDGEDLEQTEDSFLRLPDTKVYTVGIGTEKGGVVPNFDENGNRIGVKKYNGEIVMSRLQEKNLSKIARLNSGKYMRLSYDLSEIIMIIKDLEEMKKEPLDISEKDRIVERFYYFLIPALIFLLIETLLVNFSPEFRKQEINWR